MTRAPAPRPALEPARITYDVRIVSAEPWVIDVRATFEGGISRAKLAFPPAATALSIEEATSGAPRAPSQHGRSFVLACESTCTVRYTYDLSAAAAMTSNAVSVATASSGDLVAPGATWLLAPERSSPWTPVTLRVDAPGPAPGEAEPARFFAPFARGDAPHEYRLLARDISALGYTVWGSPTALPIKATSGSIEVLVLRGDRAANDAAIGRWVGATAAALDSVYGRFPAERVLIAVVPSEGAGVPFGRTVPAGGASILLCVGAKTAGEDLFSDWVLAHELFHLGIPSMPSDGRWLDEGLATYYEPVLRARAGLLPEQQAWAELREALPFGSATMAEPSLAAAEEHDRVYFGGAAFALAADVEIRKRTRGARSLDDGMRAALREGASATLVWPVEKFIAALDQGTGVRAVAELYQGVSGRPRPCSLFDPDARAVSSFGPSRERSPHPGGSPFEGVLAAGCAPDDAASIFALFDALGVDRLGEERVKFREGAALSSLRASITRADENVKAAVEESAQRAAAWGARTTSGAEKP